MHKNEFLTIFKSACTHIRNDYLDQEFIASHWNAIETKYERIIQNIDSKEDFEKTMDEMFSQNLTFSHCQFLTPEIIAYNDTQENRESAADILFSKVIEMEPCIYAKIPSFYIPIFSWKTLKPQLKKCEKSNKPFIFDLRLNTGGAFSAVGELLNPLIGPDITYCRCHTSSHASKPATVIYPLEETENSQNRLDVETVAHYGNCEWNTPTQRDFNLNQPVYILIGERNYSCGEIFSQAMKELSDCTIIGSKTAGAVVGGRDDYDCTNGYRVLLPFLNIYSNKMVELEGLGVSPHIDYSFTTPDTDVLSEEEISQILKLPSSQHKS
jgi:C-terminal processing protease CtpA/Prc